VYTFKCVISKKERREHTNNKKSKAREVYIQIKSRLYINFKQIPHDFTDESLIQCLQYKSFYML
jgi:hypothetical protein